MTACFLFVIAFSAFAVGFITGRARGEANKDRYWRNIVGLPCLVALLLAGSAQAQHCGYSQSYVAPVVQTVVQPTILQLFVPTFYAANQVVVSQPATQSLAVPASATVAAPASNCDAMASVMKELLGEVRAMRAERQSPQQPVPLMAPKQRVGDLPPEVIQGLRDSGWPGPATAPKQTQAEPIDSLDGAVVAAERYFVAKCASCHVKEVPSGKRGDFVMFDGGKLLDFTPEQERKIMAEVRDGHMPLRGPAPTANEINMVASRFVAKAK